MKKSNVTVAIPTYNRACYLGEAIQSVLAQSFDDFELLVIDNASTDNSAEVVHHFDDPRISYIRNERNLGMLGNWNRAIELSSGQYLMILGDDDKLLPEFLARSVSVLNAFPSLGFTFAHCNKVDEEGRVIRLWGYDFPPSGFINGYDYLLLTAKYGCCLTNSSTVLIRKEVFSKVGMFNDIYGYNTFDFNMWIRIADGFDVYFINEILTDYRIHQDQVSEIHWRNPKSPTGPLGSVFEIVGAISKLLQHDRILSLEERRLLADSLADLSVRGAQLVKMVIPDF